jgi:phosphatidylglycerophosphate synthase
MLAESREKFKKIEILFGKIFSKFGLSPNQFTILTLLFALTSFFSLLKEKMVLALIFYFLAIVLDFVDGAVARFKKMETKKGAYLDTIFDRYVEGLILFSFLFFDLPKILLPANVWIFLAFFGSMMTTYSKAAAKEKELVLNELKKGFFGRGERVILIFLTIFLGIFNKNLMIYPLIILAIFSNLTAFQRISFALQGK